MGWGRTWKSWAKTCKAEDTSLRPSEFRGNLLVLCLKRVLLASLQRMVRRGEKLRPRGWESYNPDCNGDLVILEVRK